MNKAVFFDRDGTINKDIGYLSRIEDFEFLPGVYDIMLYLQKLGYLLFVVSNQSGIGRGYYSEKQFLKVDRWMKERFLEYGITISKTYYCPHFLGSGIKEYNFDCECRKPKTGLFHLAEKEFNIDLKNSICVGDSIRDCTLCNEIGCRGFLLNKNVGFEKIPTNTIVISSLTEIKKYVKE